MGQLFTSVVASGFIIRDGNGNLDIARARKISRTYEQLPFVTV